MTSRELRQGAAEDVNKARLLHDEVEKDEKRSWSDEDEANYTKYMADSRAKIDEAVEAEGGAKRTARETELEAAEKDLAASTGLISDLEIPTETRGEKVEQADVAARMFAYRTLHGDPERRSGDLGHEWPVEHLIEYRALQADLDVSGGFAMGPAAFHNQLIKAVDDQVIMRRLGFQVPLQGAERVEGISLDTDPEDSTWTAEIGDPDEDTAMAFGGRALQPSKLSKLLKVSDKLLSLASIGMEPLIRDRLAYKQAITQEKAMIGGAIGIEPLGIFTASADGISTGRDVSTGNSTTAVTFDGLKSARGTLKQGYRASAVWIAHRDFETQVAKLKDGNGSYIWQQSVLAGDPDRLLGFPLWLSEYAENTFTTGLYVAVLGDMSNYWYADIAELGGLDRLVEKYYPRVGFVSKSWVDGMPILEEAFVRVTLT